MTKSERVNRINKILNLYHRSDIALQDIAKEVGLSKSRITQILKENGIIVSKDRKNKARSVSVFKKYGVNNVMHLQKVKDKVKEVFLNKYGVTNPSKDIDIKEKIKQTNIQKYGVDNPLKSEKIREKAKKTNIERYGKPFPAQNKEILNKIKNTYINRTGYSNPAHNPECISKRRATLIKRYNLTHHMHSPEVVEKVCDARIKSGYAKLINIEGREYTTKEVCEKYGYTKSAVLTAYKNLLEDEFLKWVKKEHDKFSSKGEKELFEYIQSIYSDKVINRYKIGKHEADIFIPSLNLAIEYNGNFWHSILMKAASYHKTKKDFFDSQGINLINIYEVDWITNKVLIKEFLKTQMGIFKNIFARKCDIRSVSNIEYKKFIVDNHLQGYSYSKVKLGLYYKNELISICSFSCPRFNKNVQWELVRFCNKLGYRVSGGFSRLFTYFVNNYNPTSIISYSDRDYFSGKIYSSVGFKFIKNTSPSYFYVHQGKKYNRILFQKHKLSKKLENFNPDISEQENMLNNGYLPIYTSGNSVFIWTN